MVLTKTKTIIVLGGLLAITALVLLLCTATIYDMSKEKERLKEKLAEALLQKVTENSVPAPVEEVKEPVILAKEVIEFDLNSSYFKSSDMKQIHRVVKAIKEANGKVNVSIKGYADKIGEDDYNLMMSNKRANRVWDKINSLSGGIVKKENVTVMGKGAIKVNGTDEGKRIVKILVTTLK
jgi:outer membrane protein OmpA-like peptidoglycan-associated protein